MTHFQIVYDNAKKDNQDDSNMIKYKYILTQKSNPMKYTYLTIHIVPLTIPINVIAHPYTGVIIKMQYKSNSYIHAIKLGQRV